MDVVFLVARILFVLMFVMSGMAHFRKDSLEYARKLGAPLPEVLVPLSGVAIVAGGLMIGLGVWADLGALILGAFVLLVAPIAHAFWKESDEEMAMMQMGHFMKNMALAGGALVIFWVYNQLQDLPLSITNSLFNAW